MALGECSGEGGLQAALRDLCDRAFDDVDGCPPLVVSINPLSAAVEPILHQRRIVLFKVELTFLREIVPFPLTRSTSPSNSPIDLIPVQNLLALHWSELQEELRFLLTPTTKDVSLRRSDVRWLSSSLRRRRISVHEFRIF